MYTRIHILLAALTGATAGVAGGYFFAKKRLEARYEALVEQEIEETREYLAKRHKIDEFETPAKALAALGKAVDQTKIDPRPSVEALIRGMGYRSAEKALEEVVARGPDAPYVLREDEYMENDSGYDQKTLTYYAGDDTLAEEDDEIIDDVERVVGKANLDKFGELSGDSRVCYVRNEKLQVEYEIILHDGTYAEVVQGIVKE